MHNQIEIRSNPADRKLATVVMDVTNEIMPVGRRHQAYKQKSVRETLNEYARQAVSKIHTEGSDPLEDIVGEPIPRSLRGVWFSSKDTEPFVMPEYFLVSENVDQFKSYLNSLEEALEDIRMLENELQDKYVEGYQLIEDHDGLSTVRPEVLFYLYKHLEKDTDSTIIEEALLEHHSDSEAVELIKKKKKKKRAFGDVER